AEPGNERTSSTAWRSIAMPSLPLARHPLAGRWLLAALVLLFVALSVRYTVKVLGGGGAVDRWREQIQQMGRNGLSRQLNEPNPAIMAVILEPFVQLPPVVGSLVWFALKAAMALVSLYWVFRLVEDSDAPFPQWAAALTVLLSLKPIVDDLNHGNVNLFIVFL